jgi:hypothetical protein
MDSLPNFQALKSRLFQIENLEVSNSLEFIEVFQNRIYLVFRSTPIFIEDINKLSEALGKYYTVKVVDKNQICFALNEADQ